MAAELAASPPEPPVAEAQLAEPPPEAEPEPEPAEPAVKPVVIDTAPPPTERKRGWWRR